MIFVSVGTQLPFERLIKGMDDWTRTHPEVQVFSQVGKTTYQPCWMEFTRKLSPNDYMEKFLSASIIVSHCGMGTIITGLENAKPMILMPRMHALGEHRNDHQRGTAAKFSRFDLIDVVETVDELQMSVDRRLASPGLMDRTQAIRASHALIDCLRVFVDPDALDKSDYG